MDRVEIKKGEKTFLPESNPHVQVRGRSSSTSRKRESGKRINQGDASNRYFGCLVG